MAEQAMTRPRRDKSQRYVFYLGLVLAAIAAVMVFVAINSADSGTTGSTVAVVVANDTIPAQTRVTSDMLSVKFLSPDAASPDAFSSRSQLVDRVVTTEIAAGAQILPSMVSDVTGDGLAFKVEPGMRGISVEVREVVTAGGNIKPGDKVDVVGVFQVDSVEAANHLLAQLGLTYKVADPDLEEGDVAQSYVLTTTLLQNVKVLGLAQTLTPNTASGALAQEVKEADAEPKAATATVQVTPAQAQMLTTADEFGILRMDARPVADDALVDVPATLIVVERTQ
jgi:pilus assembly protein CpaB